MLEQGWDCAAEGPAGDEWQEGISKQEDLGWESTGMKQGQSRAVLTQGVMLLESGSDRD